MFIGHFAAGIAARKATTKLTLPILLLASQLLDLIWPVLVILGVETVSVDHEITEVTPLIFHYPYSHSLVMAVVWSLAFAVVLKGFKYDNRDATIGALVVFSHWILDFISHIPDLPITLTGEMMVGLGLWNSITATFIVESLLFFGAIYIYKTSVKRVSKHFWGIVSLLYLIYLLNIFGPKPPIDTTAIQIAGPALAMWIFVIWAWFAEKASTKE